MIQELLQHIFGKPSAIQVADIPKDVLTPEDADAMRTIGVTIAGTQALLQKQISVQYDRLSLYTEVQNSTAHPLCSAAVDLYTSTAASIDRNNGTVVNITAENKLYKTAIDNLFERLNIEEKIYDWCYSTVLSGELFLKINAAPGAGIISIDDSTAPVEWYRIENNGQLIGFVHHNVSGSQVQSSQSANLLPPYSVVHIKINGARRRRMALGNNTGYRTSIIGVGGNSLQESTSYGTSILMPALPVYKRLRLAEDCILMARATRGRTRNIYAIGVDGNNMAATKSVIDSYSALLKRQKSINTGAGQEAFADTLNLLNDTEDLLIPVWGDVNSLKITEMKGDVDIKWISDIDKLEGLFSAAIGIPLPLLKGMSEGDGGLNPGNSLEKMDIRFSRNVGRIQIAMRTALTRIVQIHLAHLEMDPSPKFFTVTVGETSSAADEEAKDVLKKSSEVADALMDTFVKFTGEDNLDREKAFNIINTNILKIKDLQYTDLMKGAVAEPQTQPLGESILREDLQAFTPMDESKWKELYGNTKVNIKTEKAK